MGIKHIFLLSSLLFLFEFSGKLTHAIEYSRATKIEWTKDKNFDFCTDSKEFDFRNAYWLAAFSFYSYWDPIYLTKVMDAPIGNSITLNLKSNDTKSMNLMRALGFGWKGSTDYFTSTIPLPHSPKIYNDHYSSYFSAPLPFEACVKKEKIWCFGSSASNTRRSPEEIESCGLHYEKAMMDHERLRNIHYLFTGNFLTQKQSNLARKDSQRIESFVREYEQTRNTDLGLDFSNNQFENRCDPYALDSESFIPDVQAYWFESKELVVISFRGTEKENIVDWATDLASSFQLKHPLLPFWKRNVHKGFEESLEVLTPWLHKKIDNLFRKYSNASQIPIFLTGHSMGGAIANLAMMHLMERNHKTSEALKLNLKAIYTFGAPRVGNLKFASTFQKLNRLKPVGNYRLVNNRDPVTKSPCLDYVHFGTNIQLNLPGLFSASVPASQVNVLINPPQAEYNYCAYGTGVVESLLDFKMLLKDHSMESYFGTLARTRFELQRTMGIENSKFLKQNKYLINSSNSPYSYPNNCKKITIPRNLNPEYLKFNQVFLPFEIEE